MICCDTFLLCAKRFFFSSYFCVGGTCEKEGISFIGLRYNCFDEKVKTFRPDIASVQFEHFKRILSDQEAASLIKMKGQKNG